MGQADAVTGVEEADAEEFHVEEEDLEKRPFKVYFDLGLTRTVPGSRIFGVLKGAVDGGLHIPHNVKKFPGYEEPEERGEDYKYDASAHLERILGTHVQEYMEMLQEEDPERYKVQFAKFIENDIEPDGIEDLYKDCHKQIRENPKYEKEPDSKITHKRRGNLVDVIDPEGKVSHSYTRLKKTSYKQKKDRVLQKIATAQAKMAASMEE